MQGRLTALMVSVIQATVEYFTVVETVFISSLLFFQ